MLPFRLFFYSKEKDYSFKAVLEKGSFIVKCLYPYRQVESILLNCTQNVHKGNFAFIVC